MTTEFELERKNIHPEAYFMMQEADKMEGCEAGSGCTNGGKEIAIEGQK